MTVYPASTPDAEMRELMAHHGSVSVRDACTLVPCGVTKLCELIRTGELESFLDGKSRRITMRSIIARRERLLAAEKASRPTPKRGRRRPEVSVEA